MAGLAHTDHGDYAYYGDYGYDDGSLGASDATESGASSQRSRQVVLVRRSLSEGFGFTLRHFIAYPDEYEQNGVESSGESQETIFVSGVVTGGPAYLAGLQLGDRLLNVNGLPVWDLSYADVVYQVQLSGLRLVLRVVPRDDDALQQVWGDTAHHPASNLNMKQLSHLPRPPPYRPVGAAAAEDSASLNGSRRPSTLSTLSLQLPPSASTATSEHIDTDDPVSSRIRRDVDTKQQFLSRPVQPWLAAQPQTPVVREYHVNPARFPSTRWPPEAAVAAGGSGGPRPQERRWRRQRAEPATAPVGRALPPSFPTPRSSSLSISSSTDSVASLPGGVPNVTARPYACPASAAGSDSGSPEYVQYDAVTQVPRAKLPPPQHQTHIVSTRARQFETGCVDNDTYCGHSSYRSELELMAEPGSGPSVRHRRTEFERLPDTSEHESSGADEAPRRPPRSGIGNRMVIVGGPRLHAEPLSEVPYRERPPRKPTGRHPEPEPSDRATVSGWPLSVAHSAARPLSNISEADHEQSPENARKRNSAELIAGKVEEKKQKESLAAAAPRSRPQHRALRQPSYVAAVKTPTPEARPSGAVTADPSCGPSEDSSAPPQGPLPYPEAGRRPQRPDFLPLTPCHQSGVAPAPAPAAVEHPEGSLVAADPDIKWPRVRAAAVSPPLEPGKTSTPNSLVGVARRQRPLGGAGEDDIDRTVRRISYLKATAGDGVFSTGGTAERSTSTRVSKPSSPTWPISPPPASADATRQGWLRVKLATVDGKRAPDRSWRELWAVLRGDALSFYRDRKEVSQTPSSLEEQPLNVALCQLGAAEDYTRRKYVFRLLTHTRSEYLLQTEHLLEREAWLEALRPLCQQLQPEEDSHPANGSTHLSPTGLRVKLPSRQRSPTGLPPNAKARKHSQTPEQASDSPKAKSWKGRVKRQFLKIHVGSPQPAAPVLDGATLGVPLELCPPSGSNPYLPRIVEMCTGLVEERGLDSEGIYRVPGNNAAIKSLSEAVNRDIYNVDLQADPRWTDVNVISSLLKSFFRKLPDSLVTSELYPKFIDTSKIEDPERRQRLLRELVNRLPDHNYETLKHLLRHLRRVTDPSCNNKMDLKNLAIVFGPTLVRCSEDSTSALVTDMSQQCGIVKTLISEFDYYFPPEETEAPCEDRPPPLPDSSPPLSADLLDGAGRLAPLFSAGQRMDSQGSPLHPKDVVSSIIFAANRKAQQISQPECAADSPAVPRPAERSSASECNNNQIKPAPLSSCGVAGTDPAGAAVTPVHRVHVIPIRLVEEAAASDPGTGTAAALAVVRQPLSSESASLPSVADGDPCSQEDTAIRSYSGLSQTTQERIRRFEEETRAMLQRDKLREREARDRDLQRQRIEREWARAKQDLEHPDFLDELADNPADIARRITELAVRLPGLISEDAVSPGYPTLSVAESSGRRAGRARADSLPAPGRPLASSGRLYRSPRPGRRQSAGARSRKVELKRSEMALKWRPAADGARTTGPPSADRGSSTDGCGAAAVPEGNPPPTATGDGHLVSLDGDPPLPSSGDGDLVASLVHTLDQKLQELGGRPAQTEKRTSWSREMYRDPSLHRSHSASCQLQMMNGVAGDDQAVPATAPAPRPAQLTKKGMKRGIRQLWFEPRTEAPRGRAGPGSPRALKRRHTVGGSQDMERVVRLLVAASRPASCLVELDLCPLSRPVALESRV